ncbi:hypothetical protein JD844_000863 [Phrynosoma platyrhinos]|uniref:Uncharacterized protein n=1 Tax=Phrynosoma platyrhinos TaxID=52577 RepID=A0ABQ7T8W5_PHRPL|nr:hypothetical protein JD844_000863 [Phrynosoma platyrhinos]
MGCVCEQLPQFLAQPPPACVGTASVAAKQDSQPHVQGSIQAPSFLRAIWVGGIALGMGLLACLFMLVSIQCQLAMLQGELAQLRGELVAKTGEQKTSPLQQRPGNFLGPPVLKWKSPAPLQRKRREVARASREQPRQRRKQSVLHLTPARHSSNWIFHLQNGDRLSLRIPRFNATFDASGHGTFLGLLRL